MFDYLKIFLILCVVTVVSAIVVMKTVMYTGAERVVVPDIQGKKLIPALEALDERGLYLKVIRMEFDDIINSDRIVSQKPGPGSYLKRGRDVKVVISKGSREAVAPNLVGATQLRAETVLDKQNLRIGKKVSVHTENGEPGMVLAQQPAAGARLNRNDSMTLLIGAGKFIEYVSTPEFISKPLTETMEKIKEAGLKVREVDYRPDRDVGRGIVTGQEPRFGERVAKGSLVSLTVSEGVLPDDKGPSTFTFLYYTIPDGSTAVNVLIIQDNLDGEKEVYSRVRRPGDTVSVLVEVKGRTSARIYINNELVEVKRF